jgi:quinol monooxygenase YgiN
VIKVIIERQLKKGEDISPLLRELRATAVHQPGYVTGETLVGTEDRSDIVVLSTWQNMEQWRTWEASPSRAKLYEQIKPMLVEKPKVKVYEIMATEK